MKCWTSEHQISPLCAAYLAVKHVIGDIFTISTDFDFFHVFTFV